MNKKPYRGIPAPFHAAVVFAVFFSLLGTPLSKGNQDLGGLRGILAKFQSFFFDDRSSDTKSTDTKSNNGDTKKGGRKFWIYIGDGTYDPPPPPPPPPNP